MKRLVCPIAMAVAGAGCWAQAPRSGQAPAAEHAESPAALDWKGLESPLLTNHVQITSRDMFVRAGEAYFDHQSPPQWIVFQAVETPKPGEEASPIYSMYVGRLKREDSRLTGLDRVFRVSPDGSANTCGWFHPSGRHVLFGSTLTPPTDNQKAGFQVGTRKYVWMFPSEMDIVIRDLRAFYIEAEEPGMTLGERPTSVAGVRAISMISRPNYDAECSYSRDGRFVLYAHVRDEMSHGRPDADIYIFDAQTRKDYPIVVADGYDGGPFFSPDGKMICYRSDRRGDDLLQLFVAELKIDGGVPVGIIKEHQLTDDQAVNWAPYWHPSGKFLVYGTSAVDPRRHSNYEVFAAEVDLARPAAETRRRRVTFGAGADVLPVFSDDGSLMMWTAQRGPMTDGESKPSSQLWIAEVVKGPGGFADPATMFDNLPDQRPEHRTEKEGGATGHAPAPAHP